MTKKLLLFLALTVLSLSLKIQHELQTPTFVGGYTTGDVSNPDRQIDQYLRGQFPEVKDARLVKVETQVVAGINYRYTYQKDGIEWTLTCWDQSWTKFRQLTGITKSEIKTDANGKKTQVITNTRIQTRPFNEVAKEYFKNNK